MGVTLQRVFAPIQGGGFLTANHGLFFVYYLQLLFSLLNNPLLAPPHYSGAQEPSCQPIEALPPPLLQEPRQPSSCHRVLYPRYYRLVGTFSCDTAPSRGALEE